MLTECFDFKPMLDISKDKIAIHVDLRRLHGFDFMEQVMVLVEARGRGSWFVVEARGR